MAGKRKTVFVDLGSGTSSVSARSLGPNDDYGRGYAVKLLRALTGPHTDRLDPDNPLIFVPGLFLGNGAPSACRMVVASKRGKGEGAHIANISGDMPLRLASSGTEALVITGRAAKPGTVVVIDADRVEILERGDLAGLPIPEILARLRDSFGAGCSITGAGPAADALLPLSSLFNSFSGGVPPYNCPRNSFGDVAGSKNLKAIVVRHPRLFEADCVDRRGFARAAARLGKLIRDNPVCGGALPGYGSIALMEILQANRPLPPASASAKPKLAQDGQRRHKACSPVCVIGCLNRRGDSGSWPGYFEVPEVSEVESALARCFGLSDFDLVRAVMARCYAIGLNATEFVFSANLYCKAVDKQGQTVTAARIDGLLAEVEKLSLTGRILAGGSPAVFKLFRDKSGLEALVSKPSIRQEKDFRVSLFKPAGFEDVDDMEMLYRGIFILENLGLCIFTSFALLNNAEALQLLSDMYAAKTGNPTSAGEFVAYAARCIAAEMDFQQTSAVRNLEKSIPEFTKVLYRYFQSS